MSLFDLLTTGDLIGNIGKGIVSTASKDNQTFTNVTKAVSNLTVSEHYPNGDSTTWSNGINDGKYIDIEHEENGDIILTTNMH